MTEQLALFGPPKNLEKTISKTPKQMANQFGKEISSSHKKATPLPQMQIGDIFNIGDERLFQVTQKREDSLDATYVSGPWKPMIGLVFTFGKYITFFIVKRGN